MPYSAVRCRTCDSGMISSMGLTPCTALNCSISCEACGEGSREEGCFNSTPGKVFHAPNSTRRGTFSWLPPALGPIHPLGADAPTRVWRYVAQAADGSNPGIPIPYPTCVCINSANTCARAPLPLRDSLTPYQGRRQ